MAASTSIARRKPAVQIAPDPAAARVISETTEIRVPTQPGDPLGAVATVVVTASPTDEYVSAGGWGFLPNYLRTLPPYIDDATRDFGADLYHRMRFDPQIESAVSLLIMAVLAQGWQIQPAVEKDQPGYDAAQRYADFVTWNLNRMRTPFQHVLYELAMGCCYGHKVAEQVYDYVPWQGRVRLALDALKTKAHTATAFVVDVRNNVAGMVYVRPGQTIPSPLIMQAWIMPGAINDVSNILIPRTKFVIFAFRSEDGDPRGTSILRSSYHAFWKKGQVNSKQLAYLATFAQPSIIGFTDPNSEPQLDPDDPTAIPESPEKRMLAQLQKVQNGACGAFPGGAKVEVLQAKGEGKVFLEALGEANHEITKGILCQTLATDEGIHMARAASETHQDILGILVRYFKQELADTITRDLIRPLIAYNFGDAAADGLCPVLTLGATEHQDFPQNARGVADLMTSGIIHWSQYAGLDRFLGLPPRDMEAQVSDIEAERTALAAQAPQIAQAQQSMTQRVIGRRQGMEIAGRSQGGTLP